MWPCGDCPSVSSPATGGLPDSVRPLLVGGRALWGVPKQLGTFAFTPSTGRVRTRPSPKDLPADEPVTAWHQDLLRLPARLPLRGGLLQPAPGPAVPPKTVRVPLRLWPTHRRT